MSTPDGGPVDGAAPDDSRPEQGAGASRPAPGPAAGTSRPEGDAASGTAGVAGAGGDGAPVVVPAAPGAPGPSAATAPPSIPVGAVAPRSRAETHPDTDEIEVVLPLSVVRVVPNPAHDGETAMRPPPVKKSGAQVPDADERQGRGRLGTRSPRPAAAAAQPARPGPDARPTPAAASSSSDPDEALRAARAAMTPGRRLRSAFRPRMTRAQVLAAVLCAVLGFALVVQLQQNQQDEFSGLRQSDLVRILDDVSKRSDSLEREASSLRETEFELRSGSDSQQAAVELAEKNAEIQGILSGRLPAEGPGLEIQIVEGDSPISAARLFNVLEELRNAGAEAIDVNGIRMVTSSYFEDTATGVSVDGIVVAPPYRWTVIGDPQTLEPAMAIPGGAMASITTSGGRTTIAQKELVQIRSVRDPAEPRYAKPATDE